MPQVKPKTKIPAMRISYSHFTIAIVSFTVLLGVINLPFSTRLLAQTQNQQEQQQQDLLSQISNLEYLNEQDISGAKTEELILQLQKILQTAQKSKNTESTLTLLNIIVNTYNVEDALLGKLIAKVKPNQKQTATNLLSVVMELTRSINTSYSFEKTIIYTRTSNYWQRIGEQQTASQALTEALIFSQIINKPELQAKVLVPIAKEYITLKQTAKAEEILSTALQVSKKVDNPDPGEQGIVLEGIASSYIQLGKPDIALEISQSISYLYYRSYVVSQVVQHLIKNNQLAAATEMTQRVEIPVMKGERLLEISLVYTKQKEEKLASKLFADALAAISPEEEYSKGYLIQSYAQAGQLDAAYVAAQKLENQSVLTQTLGAIATEYSKVGQVQKSEKIIRQILPLIAKLEMQEASGLLSGMLFNFTEAKQYKLAFDLVTNLKNPNLLDQGNWILQIGNAAIKDGQIEVTLKAAQSLSPRNIAIRNQLLQKIALVYSQNQQLDKALALVPQINNSGGLPYQIETMALIATSNGKNIQTDRLLTQAIADAKKLQNQPRALALTIVARSMFEIANQQRGQQLLKEAIQLASKEKNAALRQDNLVKMEELLMSRKKYFAALQVVQANPTETQESKLVSLTQLVVENGNQQIDIVTIYKQIKTPETKTTGLIGLAETYIGNQKIAPARKMLELALAAAKTIPDPESRTWSFGSLPDGSPSTIVEDDYDRASSLEKIAVLQAKIGDYQQALQVAKFIQDQATRNQLINKLAEYKSNKQQVFSRD